MDATADATLRGIESIAVLRANALGDFILTLPALEALKRAYPRARVTLFGLDWHTRFLAGRPSPVDEVIAVPPIPGLTGPDDCDPAVGREFLASMREREFDLAIQLHGGGRTSNPFVNGLGARHTAGARTPDAEMLDLWVPYFTYQHEAMRCLEVVSLVGASPHDRVEPRLTVTDADRAELAEVFGEVPDRLVAVHPGAGDTRRRWPPERFAAVADAVAEEGHEVVITATEPERETAEKVAAEMSHPARLVVNELTIGGLAALYERSRLLISNDTGPRHVAQAIGTPTVGVYWCGNVILAGPQNRARHRPLISWTIACPECGTDCVHGETECSHTCSFVTDVPTEAVRHHALDLLR
ncbi:glycosyltransferase family 9 protein [Bailinhaonella thermotolerans]|uniref:Glycosyltransferase family 9 protein n=1 Tax=Bailinhaonella thermotolerans TaxID=1070861 RepID=A0A3A4AZD7_9ACTN|nr:glycosyltransferase family 9 protein [Bailinhaonella thermotolerans]RJL34493.1 glycosyltransferase family 9 protein [Bailinhaonella thermotolerans]